jgi:phage tail-like protein
MDSNGLRFWMLSDESDWSLLASAPAQPSGAYYCASRKRVRLRSTPDREPPAEVFGQAVNLLNATPFARDQFGNYARWDAGSGHVVTSGSGPDEVPIYAPPPLETVTDLVLGYDGVLYIAVAGQLVFVDRKNRWPNFTFPDAATKYWRLAAHPNGGVLALDRDTPQLVRIEGLPLGDIPACQANPGVLRPCDDNPNPPRVSARAPLPAGEFAVAIAGDGAGGFALLSWNKNDAGNDAVWLRTFKTPDVFDLRKQLAGPRFPYAMAWLDEGQIALLATQNIEAVIYAVGGNPATLSPSGDTYVLADVNVGPFAHGFDRPPQYNKDKDLFPLLPLSLNSLTKSGSARNLRRLDSGSARTAWHRLYLEAALPQRCGVIVWLAAADDPSQLDDPAMAWFPHVFGDAEIPADFPEAPKAMWLRQPSEVPFHSGLMGESARQDRSGLFMVLVQRAGVAVRTLRGRYLGVRLDLNGDGRSTPEIAAVRVYGPRFSYLEHYLPEIYREDTFGPEADLKGPSTPPDFLERFVDTIEAALTQMEDRVASSYRLTNPLSTLDDSIDWLGSWIGVDPDPEPPGRRRDRVRLTPKLYRERGAVQGVRRALDIATGGLCERGAVILLEDYRLRHTFATILGANLSPQDDQLLPGHWESSNSFVGDTLFLGDEHKKEFLSLFANAIENAKEQQQVDAFFANLANRLTVFIHDQVETVDQQVVRRVVEREKPAHVAASYLRATQPFLIGLASLVGANTYLTPVPPRELARVDQSSIGGHAFIGHLPSLDPRLEDVAKESDFAKPIARVTGPNVVLLGQPISLDGSASAAPPGQNITQYLWTIVKGPDK